MSYPRAAVVVWIFGVGCRDKPEVNATPTDTDAPQEDTGPTPDTGTDTQAETECAVDVLTYDYGADGVPDTIQYWYYSTEGHKITRDDTDQDADGDIDYRRTYLYENGLWVGYEVDGDMDGIADDVWEHTYNSQKLLEEVRYDEGCDGDYDMLIGYRYDRSGVMTGLWIDDDADGEIDKSIGYAYEGDLITQVSTDLGVDGTVDSVVLYTYDQDGCKVLEETYEADVLTAIVTHTCADGAIMTTTRDSDADGVPEQITDYTRNAFGYTTYREDDTDADGLVDVTVTYDLTCW